MSMKFSIVGEKIRGFALAREKGAYGVVEVNADPGTICDYVSYKSYSYTIRYIYSTPLIIFYPDYISDDEPVSVQGVEESDKIMGGVLIFGKEDGIRSLTDFEIMQIKENVTMEKSNQINHLRLSNVSKEPIIFCEPL